MALLQKSMRFAILIFFLCSCANSSPPSPESSQAPVEASYQEDDASPKLQEGTNRDQLESAEVTNAAIASANRGDMEAAMALLAKATTLDPDNDNAWFTWGRIYEQEQDYRSAVDAFGRAVLGNESNPEYHYFLGKSLWMLSPTEHASLAHDALTRAVLLDAAHARAHYFLGLVLERQDKADQAAQALTRSIELEPSFGRATDALARLYIKWHKLDEALAVLEHGRLHVKDPALLTNIYYELGRIFHMQNRWTNAIWAQSEALQIQPDNLDALRQRGFAYAEAGDAQAARSDLEAFIKEEAGGDAFEMQAAMQRLDTLSRRSTRSATVKPVMPAAESSKLTLPAIPSFEVPAMIGDAHLVSEVLLRSDRYQGSELQIRGTVTWVYDCAQWLRRPGLSKKELARILKLHPERCQRPHFRVADGKSAPADQYLQVVDVPRAIRPDEQKALPQGTIDAWPAVPKIKVGDQVIITGTWAKHSPLGFSEAGGLLIYKSVQHL